MNYQQCDWLLSYENKISGLCNIAKLGERGVTISVVSHTELLPVISIPHIASDHIETSHIDTDHIDTDHKDKEHVLDADHII